MISCRFLVLSLLSLIWFIPLASANTPQISPIPDQIINNDFFEKSIEFQGLNIPDHAVFKLINSNPKILKASFIGYDRINNSGKLKITSNYIKSGEVNLDLYLNTTKYLTPNFSMSQSWQTVSSSDNGQIVLVGNTNNLYLSKDNGNTWKEIQPEVGADFYRSSSMSSDGTKILVGTNRLYLSKDIGETWQEVRPAGEQNKNWRTLSVSSDGTKMLAGIHFMRGGEDSDGINLFSSLDSGETWQEVKIPAEEQKGSWYYTLIREDGKMLAGGYQTGSPIFIQSLDGGKTWQNANFDLSYRYELYDHNLARGKDGKLEISFDAGETWQLFVFDKTFNKNDLKNQFEETMYTKNYGKTWSKINLGGDVSKEWGKPSVSADGKTILVSNTVFPYKSEFLLSKDGGQTWQVVQLPINLERGCGNCLTNVSADGQQMVIYIKGSNSFYSSKDGAKTWSEIKLDSYDYEFYYVSSDAQYVVAYNSHIQTISYSSDAGQTWTEM
nr:hypothetical protein [Candidatus Gracilibacteria bacterium]